jgi:hypothetical protein
LFNIIFARVLSGEFQIVNQHLLRDLTERNLWNEDVKNEIIKAGGSIQGIQVRSIQILLVFWLGIKNVNEILV